MTALDDHPSYDAELGKVGAWRRDTNYGSVGSFIETARQTRTASPSGG